MDSLFHLEGKSVVIAGAAGAFGSAIARQLNSCGCNLTLFDKNEEKLTELVSSLSSKSVHSLLFDVTDTDKCYVALQESVQHWGSIDGFINCVGLFEILPATELPHEVFSKVIDTNLNAAFSLSRYVASHMMDSGGGRIIHISSVSDTISNPGYAAYASSKAALSHLIRVFAVEWAEHAITVNAICPAIAVTDLTRDFLNKDKNREIALSRIPMGRFFEPSDILGTVILLLSDGGSFITGQAIHIDGGRTIS